MGVRRRTIRRILLGIALGFLSSARAEDLWFLVTSDSHYKNEATNNIAQNGNVLRMNAIAGKKMPEKLGGAVIGEPVGVLVLGDCADGPSVADWRNWQVDFGLNGQGGTLKFPVYEGWGNHDVSGLSNYDRSPVLKRQKDGDPDGILERNTKRIYVWGGVTNRVNLSPSGFLYSWDWDRVHLIQTGYAPCEGIDPQRRQMGGKNYDPVGALAFVQQDLKERVGDSGRPVILMHHYDVNSGFGWTQAEIDRYFEAVKGYNVIAVMYGHTSTGIGLWREKIGNGPPRNPEIHTINTGHLAAGFWVVQVTADTFRIAYTTGQDENGNPTWAPQFQSSWSIASPPAAAEKK